MKSKSFFVILTLVLVVIFYESAYCQGLPQRAIEKIGDGVYVATGFVSNNMGIIVTRDGVIVIDTGTSPDIGNALLTEVKKLSDKPIKYVIYTHYHYDHINGSSAFKSKDTVFVAHKNFLKNYH